MKFSTKCRNKKLGNIYTSLGSICSFLIGMGPIFGPKSDLGKSLVPKNYFLYFSTKTYVLGTHKEPSHREHQKHMLKLMDKKISTFLSSIFLLI